MARPVRLRALRDGTTVAEPEETIELRQLFDPWTLDDLIALQREIAASYRQMGHPPAECFISPRDFGSLVRCMAKHAFAGLRFDDYRVVELDGTRYFPTLRWPVGTLGYVVNL